MLTSVGIYAAQHVDVLDIMSKQLIMFLKLIFWPYLTHRPLNCTFIVGSYKETQIYKGGKKKLLEEEEEKLLLEVNSVSLTSTLDGITLRFKDLSRHYDLVFYPT